jgi:hypothetical protein
MLAFVNQLWLKTYLGSNGRRKSGIPASFSFCLTQSISQDGRMMFSSPLFSSEATLTVSVEMLDWVL